MSMPTPPQHQGPYGHPQQPNPYGGQQYPQQPYPPQQHPQQQQPYPGQGMWGQPPMGPPPKKNRTAMTLSITFGSIIFLLVLSWFGNRGSDAASRSGSAPFPSADYRLTLPATLLDGEYKLIKDSSEDADADMKADGYGDGPDTRNAKAAVGSYNGNDVEAPDGLIVVGLHGQFKNPTQSRANMLKDVRESDTTTEPNAPRMITPPGSDVTLECTVLVSKDGGVTTTTPLCAWSDENTVASVMLVTPAGASTDPGSVDLDAVAETTVKVRDEIRQPIG